MKLTDFSFCVALSIAATYCFGVAFGGFVATGIGLLTLIVIKLVDALVWRMRKV
jgi:hypothetical protein